MKRSRDQVKGKNCQRSISSYFTQVPATQETPSASTKSSPTSKYCKTSQHQKLPVTGFQDNSQPVKSSLFHKHVVEEPQPVNQNPLHNLGNEVIGVQSEVRTPRKQSSNVIQCPSSPDVIPSTPSPKCQATDKLKLRGKSSFSLKKVDLHNLAKKSDDSSVTNLASAKKAKSDKCIFSFTINDDDKQTNGFSPNRAPRGPSNSSSINCDKRKVISPIRLEGDEVLKSMLEQLSSSKPVNVKLNKNSLSGKKILSSCKRDSSSSLDVQKALSTTEKDSKHKAEGLDCTQDERHGQCIEVKKKKFCSDISDKKGSAKCRRSIQSPSISDSPELKYPPLHISSESKKKFGGNDVVEEQVLRLKEQKSSPGGSKQTVVVDVAQIPFKVIAEEAIIEAGVENAVRRSPRKHSSPSSSAQAKVHFNENAKEAINEAGVEISVRRSPRKHSSPSTSAQEIRRTPKKGVALEESLPLPHTLKSYREPVTANKENNIYPPLHLRRSPRKLNSTPVKIPAKSEADEAEISHDPVTSLAKDVKSSNISVLQPTVSQSLNRDCDPKFDALSDANDDIALFIANLNEEEWDPLDLHEAQTCEVLEITIATPSIEAIVHVKSVEKHRKRTCCRVQGCWLSCPVSVGDTISLQAVREGNNWILNDSHGFLVIHPDLLISGTTVVGSLFCARRSVLSSFFHGLDSDSPIMVIGSIVHQLFQMVLKENKTTEAQVRQLSEDLLSSQQCIRMLHAANMSMGDIEKEISGFIPRIVDFIQKYRMPTQVSQNKRNSAWLGAPPSPASPSLPIKAIRRNNHWNGKILAVQDIEETLWDPKLGIKGMVDVSVQVQDSSGKSKLVPLELKTGKASFSAEHRGQVTLYTMMMSRMGEAVDSGLLLYLREGQLQEVSMSHHERKDLLQLRNTLAHYLLLRIPALIQETGQFAPLKLPKPISFENACKKCPYATLCSVYLKEDGISDLDGDHPMVSISSSKTHHLTQSHIEYFLHWVGLLFLEETDQLQTANFRYIWRFSPEERENRKQAIVNLTLKKPGVDNGGKFYHTFTRQAMSPNKRLTRDIRDCGLKNGDFIIISTDNRLAIDRGNIINVDSSSVIVSTNRNLFERYAKENFHLDVSESNTVLVFNLTNLGCLLEDTEPANNLRKIIIDRVLPTFSVKIDKSFIQKNMQIFKKLNRNQRNALLKTLQADNHLLIKGLPGTGKTATMVALVELLVRAGMSVLVTSHTHSAVDNLLLRLLETGLQFIRLGSNARIHPQLHQFSESLLTQNCKTPEDMAKVFNQQQVVGVTCLGAAHAMLSQQRVFDVCLVDESTQVLQPAILRPLFCARRFVLVGDPQQLPPVVRCHKAQEQGLSESLFARLDSEAATVSLTHNYRMNRVITKLANGLTYGGKLTCGSEDVACATLKLSSLKVVGKSWLSRVLSSDIEDSVLFLDTSRAKVDINPQNTSTNADAREESACVNHIELTLVLKMLNAFIDGGVNGNEIGVMAPYRAQVSLLSEAIKNVSKLSEIEVNTVDQFQGRDKQVIVYSCTRSDAARNHQPKEREILNDKRRLTVAITRAKHKLILVGHSETLKLYSPFLKLLSCFEERNIVSISGEG